VVASGDAGIAVTGIAVTGIAVTGIAVTGSTQARVMRRL